MVLLFDLCENVAGFHIGGGIVFHPLVIQGIAEYLPAIDLDPLCRPDLPPCLDPLEEGDNIGAPDLSNGAAAEDGEYVVIEPSLDGVAVADTPYGLVLCVPFKGDPFERPLFRLQLFLPGLPDLGRVNITGKEPLCLLPALPRLG